MDHHIIRDIRTDCPITALAGAFTLQSGMEVRKPNLGIGWRVPDESLTVGHEQLACLSKEEVAVGGGDGERDAA